ncbi:Uncharacterised protein [Klebsiella quasipneumoniae]|nr:Uncharacterised protein [Klebsiella pneumoniae]VGG57383.1 Uncharacterised protein [Klebsiella quasipneumoniae]
MNNRPMKGYGNQTRAEHFRMLDAPTLSPLPLATYEYTEYKAVKVGPDYHVEYARHWYSVLHELVEQRLSLKAGQAVVQIWHKRSVWRSIREVHMSINISPTRYICRLSTGGMELGRRNV